ncbi:leucine efflux protein [Microtetraspora sp. NBRC 13810]|uniref:leucine efflux protein LeuE n=1 Tax=Microtetraspora sp. NBRC 13810 TaxID=3030990 RepID=UPI0024A36713|nr:leucine efflux protein LeuE [Microtetraspora sp. NBRC 13810]GLW04881.1 leucine efflux protein [Microtetraspora sp. NBRC 13810]
MFFGVTDLWTFTVGAFFIILLPGPNSLFVLSTAARHGVRRGYRAAAGVFLGDTVLMVLASAGVASLLQSTPALFTVLKYAGAAYLAWIGLQMLRSAWRTWRPRPVAEATSVTEVTEVGVTEVAVTPAADRPFRKALTISLLNPKAILFFVSFFIQFVDPAYATPALSFVILGAICQVFSMLYLSVLIFSGTFLAGQFRRRRALSAGLTMGAGALFLGFGATLATASLG